MKLRYRYAYDGITSLPVSMHDCVLDEPFGNQSGYIPPPTITFMHNGRELKFHYAGPAS